MFFSLYHQRKKEIEFKELLKYKGVSFMAVRYSNSESDNKSDSNSNNNSDCDSKIYINSDRIVVLIVIVTVLLSARMGGKDKVCVLPGSP